MNKSACLQQNQSNIQQKCQELTLTDIFNVPNNKIHSKKVFSKFNHLRSATSNYEQIYKEIQMMKIKQNLAKMSYTIKTIQAKDDQIGVKSKRVPLRTKHNQYERLILTQRDSRTSSQFSYQSTDKFVPPSNNFVSKPFVIIKKTKKIKQRPSSQLQVVSTNLNSNKSEISINNQSQSLKNNNENGHILRRTKSNSSTKFKLLKQQRKLSFNNRKLRQNIIDPQKNLGQIPVFDNKINKSKISFSQYLSNLNEIQIKILNKKKTINQQEQEKLKIQNLKTGKSGQLLQKIHNWQQKQKKQLQSFQGSTGKCKDTPFKRYNTKKVYESWVQNKYIKEKYRFWKQSRQSNKQN